jgi:hypothetical protein
MKMLRFILLSVLLFSGVSAKDKYTQNDYVTQIAYDIKLVENNDSTFSISPNMSDGAGNPIDSTNGSLNVKVSEPLNVNIFDSNGTALSSVNNTLKVGISDGDGNPLSSYYNAATDTYVLNTHDADVHNIPINQFFHDHPAIDTNLTVATSDTGGDYVITVTSTVGFIVGDYIQIGAENHTSIFYQIVSLTATTMTLDAYVDNAFPIGTAVQKVIIEMNVIGTLASPAEYIIAPNPGQVIHITRIIITMTHSSAGDLGLFGNLSPLTNGVLIRANVNGQYGTFTNWKTNEQMKSDMYDVEFDTRSSGGGTYGTSGRGSFWKIGVVLRLDGNQGDFAEVYIRDDLTGLISFEIKAQGHAEGL